MPAIGTPSTWARVLAVSTPTRSPVNSPGPTPTATPPTRCRSSPDHARSCSRAGVTDSWRARPAIDTLARISMSLPMATLVCGVDVSIPRTITARRSTGASTLSRRSHRSIQAGPPGVSTSRRASSSLPPVSSIVT